MIKTYLLVLMVLGSNILVAQHAKPFRIGIAGLTHTHVHWLLGRAHDGDIEIVGIAEKNRDLAERFLKQHDLPMTLLYPSIDEMIEKTRPEAVTAFGSIYEHLDVVRKCAPRKIHIMVEKPLAVNLEHAREMEALVREHKVHLLTNYETTWYASNHKAYSMLPMIGDIRKIVVHDGHPGPKEIGCNPEFLEWLTDPNLNGGGALTDFGCYGLNLATWLMKGQRPVNVLAVTQQIKPDIYPKVEDEATVILTYPKTQVIVQASWNWPYNRKDMEVYGRDAYVIADRETLRFREGDEKESLQDFPALTKPHHDPFAYLAAVVRGEISPAPYDLSSLENNMIVVELLELAKKSASSGSGISLQH